MSETPEYISRLLDVLDHLDQKIGERKTSLDNLPNPSIPGTPSTVRWGSAEALAAHQSTKRKIIKEFPELKDFYKGNLEEKIYVHGSGPET